jgi:hypothetical protein
VHAKGARLALDASFVIPQVEVRTPTPPFHHKDPLADSDEEDDALLAFTKSKGKSSTSKVRELFSLFAYV